MEDNITAFPGIELEERYKRTQAEVITVATIFVLITTCAFISNLGVIGVILKTSHLRGSLTYLFMLNLCIADLLNSVAVLPFNIVTYLRESWTFGDIGCKSHGFISAVLMYVSIFSSCFISIERYYSIRAPMHYAAHMTLFIVLGIGVYLWFQAIFIALSPLLGWNSFDYREATYQCSYSVSTSQSDQSYAIFIFTLCFLVPALVICVMYVSIYQVAKLTSTQVHPFANSLRIENDSTMISTSISNPSVSGTSSSRSGQETGPPISQPYVPSSLPASSSPVAGRGKIATVESDRNIIGPTIPPVQILLDGVATPKADTPFPTNDILPSPSEEGSRRNLNTHWKAAKTLFCITAAFLCLWGPHFFLNLCVATGSQVSRKTLSVLAPCFLWIGYTSFAVNPIIYGLLNRNIREALIGTFEQLRSSLSRAGDDQLNAPGDEDFFQFLERTSTVPSVSPQPKSNLTVGGQVFTEESESGFESSAFP